MRDSFFTARSGFDEQASNWSAGSCEQIIEAGVRRMIKLQGTFETAKRVQRLADICAGAHVLPIEHWQKVEPPPQVPLPASKGWIKRYIRDNTVFAFWLGTLFGCFISGGK